MTPPKGPRHVLSVLVVDDETIVRQSLGAWLREDGHRVEVAENARQALRMVAEGEYDLALIDIKMPGMDGIEVLKRLRQEKVDAAVVIVTATTKAHYEEEAEKLGISGYLHKPFEVDEVEDITRRVLH